VRYFVEVDGTTVQVDVDGESVTVDGKTHRAHVEPIAGTPLHQLTLGDAVHRVHAQRGGERGLYDVRIEGHRVSAHALDERGKAIRELGGAAARKAGPAHLMAPMPGLVVRINVAEGEQVRAGQGLVVMEAMKMENELRAVADGTVKRVVAAVGAAVEKGALLLEMEAP
jgi:biotin carboxyl carrier protein